MQRTSKSGHVFELTTHHPGARLYDYDIDGDTLKFAHMKWLDENIVNRIKGSSDTWRISLSGSTDRLGSSDYNLGLSERRAKQVRRYITTHPALAGVKLIFDMKWLGEVPASLHDKDETRDDWERAVLVTMNLHSEPPPRPVPPAPSPNIPHPVLPSCVTKASCPKSTHFSIKIVNAVEVSLPGVPIAPAGAVFTFLLRDSTNRLEAKYELHGKGLSISPSPLSFTGKVTTFSDFITEYETRVVDFGAMASITIPTIPPKPGPFPPMPSLASMTVSYDKGTFFSGKQHIKNIDTGTLPIFSSIPGFSTYSGFVILVSKCSGGVGAARY